MADLTSSTPLVELSKFRVPSTILLFGQSSSGAYSTKMTHFDVSVHLKNLVFKLKFIIF